MYHASSGTNVGALVDSKLIFVAAFKVNAHSIILTQNHPSGSLMPSNAHSAQTQRFTDAGEMVGIIVFDDLILTPAVNRNTRKYGGGVGFL
ncbi:JAB domain-containing protein [Mucilaginibacter terrae]|uniref:JAB domain-containing protein n=1 Tax=Mucilaginibacter terrae TaxID=1955052 RepID=UPI0035E20A30